MKLANGLSDHVLIPEPGDFVCVIAGFGQHRVRILAEIGAHDRGRLVLAFNEDG